MYNRYMYNSQHIYFDFLIESVNLFRIDLCCLVWMSISGISNFFPFFDLDNR